MLIYHQGTTAACARAARILADAGIPLTDHPSPEVTHLLLDIPSFSPEGTLRGGGTLKKILEMLPPQTRVIGGGLIHPDLQEHPVLDLLADDIYLAYNAAITAHCALEIAASALNVTFQECPTLIIGWGRIGKCLARLLANCPLTVAARNSKDRAMVAALGWKAADILEIPLRLPDIRLLINTVPAPLLNAQQLNSCPNCVKLDLASSPGLQGTGVIHARGLPGRCAPESSGNLIARRILTHWKEGTL